MTKITQRLTKTYLEADGIWSDSIPIPHQNLNTSILQNLRTSIPIPIPILAKLKTSIPIPIPIPLKTSIPQYLVLVLSMSAGYRGLCHYI